MPENDSASSPAPPPPPHRQSLTVLPHSGKVDRLKEELTADTTVDKAASSPPPVSPYDAGRSMHHSPADLTPAQRAIEAMVVEVLRSVFDPEIPVNIYELGLIYNIDVNSENHVHVKMTLTAPGCPVAGSLPLQVEQKIENIPEVKSADVELVWDPPWDKARMSEGALLDLGMF